MTLAFAADAQALAKYAGSDAVRPALESACSVVFPGTSEIRVAVEAGQDETGATENGLTAEAENDPGIVLARSIIGGEIVRVRPDGRR